MSTNEDRIIRTSEKWFLTEPLLFATYCTHTIVANLKLKVPFRTGKKRIEFSPVILDELEDLQIEELLKIEVLRILLKHPYHRQPQFVKRKVLTQSSNVTINDSYMIKDFVKTFIKGLDYKLPRKLCFEEYYAMIYEILSHANPNSFCGTSIVPTNKPANSDDDDDDGGLDNDINVEQNGFSPEEQLSELWEDDEETCCSINDIIEVAQASDNWGTVSRNLKDTIKAGLKVAMDYRRMLSHFRTSVLSSKRSLTRMRQAGVSVFQIWNRKTGCYSI